MTIEFIDVYGDGSLILQVQLISLIRPSTIAGRCIVRCDGKETEVKMTAVQLLKKSRFVRE